ncbi:hypothetical protein [Burkholderia ubonensis]|uniref:hypothetical protein n=1 Tax=Burkholderia ubonensis TaxID=101571 RepID=UPI000ACD06B3|nr:hypothetical protein [Burkholderia ubonensis]
MKNRLQLMDEHSRIATVGIDRRCPQQDSVARADTMAVERLLRQLTLASACRFA